jgi:hypothetical protein
MRVLREKKQSSKVTGFNGLIPVLEIFDLPALYQPFNPVLPAKPVQSRKP